MRVAELWRYPVKSLRGERLERVAVTAEGFEGDRLTRVLDVAGAGVTARTARGLLGLRAGLDGAGEPLVEGERWESDAALRAIREHAGTGARLAPPGRYFDALPILVVSDGALAALGEDRRRFRPNIVVAGVSGLDEREWVGRHLRLGTVELLVREPCERCLVTTIDPDTLAVRPHVLTRVNSEFDRVLGVLCEVAVPGGLATGDPVRLL